MEGRITDRTVGAVGVREAAHAEVGLAVALLPQGTMPIHEALDAFLEFGIADTTIYAIRVDLAEGGVRIISLVQEVAAGCG